ncbi:MAG TPA: hypothetical protein VFE30_10620 [Anaeromyxobacteraceae bacterium]|jgi:hypothetical protein|nr:hypothetical protein [Anaeromyxobacteraceae bacterium]
MTPISLEACSAALGRPVSRLAAGALAIGAAAFALGLVLGHADAALAALDASWLFFAGLSAGSVAFAAAVRVVHGGWARPVLPIADVAAGFFLPALLLLAVLAAGARGFIPWAGEAGAGGLFGLAVRLLLATGVLFALGGRFVALARRPGQSEGSVQAAGVIYVAAYAVALSIWAFELVMRLSESPPATVVPAYYFLGAFLSGLAWVALLAAVRGTSGADLRHDLGKLLFGFIVVWSYLLWALFLATWYGNVPEEAEVLLRRWHGSYRPITVAVLIAVAAWPFWLLFSETMKRRRATLAAGAGAILLGLWAERFLLVLPSLRLPGGAIPVGIGACVSLGVAGAFVLSVGSRMAALGPGRPSPGA